MSLTSNANFTFRRNLWKVTENAANNAFYIFAARSTPWPNDNNPPDPGNSVADLERKIHDEILFGKYVPAGYINTMVPKYQWEAGTVYVPYDDENTILLDENFFVFTVNEGPDYHVFKCLGNNGGAKSTVEPKLQHTSADDPFYQTADGYQWKYLYSFDQTTYNKFATLEFIPTGSNSYVTANAVPGAIETFKIVSAGGNYNSYTNGYFVDTLVGNTTQFGIQGSDTTVLSVSTNTYSVGETVTQAYGGVVANGVIVQTTTANATVDILTLRNVNNIFVAEANAIVGSNGSISELYESSSPQVSSNNNFYNGCSIYIASGPGAGQVRNIIDYIVVGNARRIIVDQEFDANGIPTLASKYVISPRVKIVGDGQGAQALSVVNPATKEIQYIQVISKGSGYTYANVTIYGNTGSISVAANTAVVRAIIPPRGGHGYDIPSELNAKHICYSTTFANTENGKLPGTNSVYRRVGLIVNPEYANVVLAFSNTGAVANVEAAIGETIKGSISQAQGFFTAGPYGNSSIKLANTRGIFTIGDVLTANSLSASQNVVVTAVTGAPTVFDNRTLLIGATSSITGGTFTIGQKIVQTETEDAGYGVIQDIQTSGSNTHIYLTQVKGYFAAGDINGNKYIVDDTTRQTSMRVDDIVQSDINKYTGNIMYFENIEPVTRNESLSETVRIIYGYK